MRLLNINRTLGILLIFSISTIYAQNNLIFHEDFEDDSLDAQASIQTIGSFNKYPGIKAINNFGSEKAYGFGRSTCSVNCYNNFVTRMIITFASPTYVDSLNFNEMELYGNWGGKGQIYIDSVFLPGSNFGRSPSNDHKADTIYRHRNYVLDTTVSVIEIRVWDITIQSEIFVDDIKIYGGYTGVTNFEITPDDYQVNVYPNPTQGNITIEIYYIEKQDVKIDISVLDYNGRTLLNRSIKHNDRLITESIDLTGFSKGIYLIETRIADRSIIKRIINLE